MKAISSITVFDNNKYFLAMLRGYCYANNIVLTELDFNAEHINELDKVKPCFVIVPLMCLNSKFNTSEFKLFMQIMHNNQTKIAGIHTSSCNSVSVELLDKVDVIIQNPFDIGEIDHYLKTSFQIQRSIIEQRTNRERRSFTERRNAEMDSYRGELDKRKSIGLADFRIDRRNRCVHVKGHAVNLTPKEFELIDLLSTDEEKIFSTSEILSHLWPENNRATKSDLYQYMHLLRKKIESDPNNPQWIQNIKGFGYRLNNVAMFAE